MLCNVYYLKKKMFQFCNAGIEYGESLMMLWMLIERRLMMFMWRMGSLLLWSLISRYHIPIFLDCYSYVTSLLNYLNCSALEYQGNIDVAFLNCSTGCSHTHNLRLLRIKYFVLFLDVGMCKIRKGKRKRIQKKGAHACCWSVVDNL